MGFRPDPNTWVQLLFPHGPQTSCDFFIEMTSVCQLRLLHTIITPQVAITGMLVLLLCLVPEVSWSPFIPFTNMCDCMKHVLHSGQCAVLGTGDFEVKHMLLRPRE